MPRRVFSDSVPMLEGFDKRIVAIDSKSLPKSQPGNTVRSLMLVELSAVYATARPTGTLLEESAKKISGYSRILRSKTSDGYEWQWELRFESQAGKLSVLFPWFKDFGGKGKGLERPLCAFASGRMRENEVERIVGRLAATLQNAHHKALLDELRIARRDPAIQQPKKQRA